MPSLLDFLGKELFGEDLAQQIGQKLTHLVAEIESQQASRLTTACIRSSVDCVHPQVAATEEIERSALATLLTPSKGIEPLLAPREGSQVDGWHPPARALAKLVVHHAKRRHDEALREKAVIAALRRLAVLRQAAAVLRCARILVRADQDSTVVDSIFDEIEFDSSELMSLLNDVVEGQTVDYRRIGEISDMIAPRLAKRKFGRKIRPSSAAFEFMAEFQEMQELFEGRHPTYKYREAEYINPVTAAIRLEFDEPRFDPRPTQRRLKKKHKLSTTN